MIEDSTRQKWGDQLETEADIKTRIDTPEGGMIRITGSYDVNADKRSAVGSASGLKLEVPDSIPGLATYFRFTFR